MPNELGQEIDRLRLNRTLADAFDNLRNHLDELEKRQGDAEEELQQIKDRAVEAGPAYTQVLEAMLLALGRADLVDVARNMQHPTP